MSIAVKNKILFRIENEYLSKYFSRTWAVCLFTLILLTLILFCRKPDAFLNPQFWAEDGAIFFKQNIEYGLESFIIPYSGYLHTVPRIVALIASWFPVSMAPTIYNFFALGVTLLAAGFVFNSRCFIPFKPLAALSLVLVPHSGEVFMNITSAQWYLYILMLVLLCMKPPTKIYQYVLDYIIIIICALTGPFILFLFPIFLIKYLTKRNQYYFGILLIAFICSLIQGGFIVNTFHSESNIFSGDITSWINLFGIKLFARLFFIKKIYSMINPVVLAICSLILPIFLIWLTSTKKQIYMTTIFLYSGLIVVLSGIYKYRDLTNVFVYDIDNGDRYFYIYFVMIMWILVVSLISTNPLKRQIGTVLIILALISTSQYFRSFNFEDYNWKQNSKQIKSGEYVRIPINPPGWFIELGSSQDNPEENR